MENKLKHLAIIMDGNRRWAQKNNLPKLKGHTEGGENLKEISKIVKEEGISYLTVFTLSTENFKERSDRELNHIFSLMERFIDNLDELPEKGVRLNTIGDLSQIPDQTIEVLEEVKEKTKDNDELVLTLAVNYGGRNEIVRAAKKVMRLDLNPKELDEKKFSNFLDTREMPAVDLLIRTGNRKRISNFMIWQAAYAEYYFTDTLWPAFSEQDLEEAIEFFETTQRNFGA